MRMRSALPATTTKVTVGEKPAEKRLTFLADMTTGLESSPRRSITQLGLCDIFLPFVATVSITVI